MRALLLAAMLAAAPVYAETAPRAIVCAGDSITHGRTDNAPSYPDRLAALLPTGSTVVNIGVAGAASNILDLYERLLAQSSVRPDTVILLFGTNDWAAGISPNDGVRHLRTLARLARSAGASRVIVLTPPPIICLPPRCATSSAGTMAQQNAHVRDLAHAIYAARWPRWITIGDLRDALALDWRAMTLEGVHPTSDGNAAIATFVASLL